MTNLLERRDLAFRGSSDVLRSAFVRTSLFFRSAQYLSIWYCAVVGFSVLHSAVTVLIVQYIVLH